MVIIEVPALMALIELYKDLAIVPGERRDIGIAFVISLKTRVAALLFEGRVGIVVLMNQLNDPHGKLLAPFEIESHLSSDEVLRELRFVGGVHISLVFGAPVASCNMDRLAAHFL